MKRRKQNHKISFHFLSGSPHTPRRKWIGKEIFGFGSRPEGARGAHCSLHHAIGAYDLGKATTRSARALVIKILRILLIQCSNFVQKTPPIFTFARNGRSERVAKRHTMPFLRYAPRFFQGQRKRAVAHEVVRLSKAQSPAVAGQPIFLFALSSDVKRFLISIALKLNFQYE